MDESQYHPWDLTLIPELEGRTEALAGTFKTQNVANTLWAYMRKLEGRTQALTGTFNTQGVASTLWAYATMGRKPGTGVMR